MELHTRLQHYALMTSGEITMLIVSRIGFDVQPSPGTGAPAAHIATKQYFVHKPV
jgi:hypothetical protein